MATTVDFTFLLALFVFLAVFSNRRSKIGPHLVLELPLVEKTSEKPWGFPSSGASWVLPIHFALKHFWFFCAQSALVHQSDDIYKAGNRANRNRNDKQGCIWLNLLAASLYHCPIFYRVISLVNDHTGSIVLQIALLDAGWIIYQCPEDHRWSKKQLPVWGDDLQKKNPKASQRTAFWNTKKLVGKDFGISFSMNYIQQLYHNPWRISPVRRTWHMTKRSTQTRVRALLLTYWRVAIQCLMIHIYMIKPPLQEIGSKISGPFPGN